MCSLIYLNNYLCNEYFLTMVPAAPTTKNAYPYPLWNQFNLLASKRTHMKVACSNWTRVAHVQLQQIKNSCHLMDCAQYVSCDSSLGYSVILLSSGNLRIWLLNTVCIDILFVINLIYLQKGHMKVACSNWTRVACAAAENKKQLLSDGLRPIRFLWLANHH